MLKTYRHIGVNSVNKSDFLKSLKRIESLKFGNFILASGKQSDYYLDLRVIPYHPEFFEKIISDLCKNILNELDFDIVCGIPTAGVPIATLVSQITKVPLIMLRKVPKKHGLGKLIEGGPVNNKKVLIVDDLVSSGHSKEVFIKNLRENGAIVENLVVLVDRRDKLNRNFKVWEKNMEISVHYLFEISKDEILNYKDNVD